MKRQTIHFATPSYNPAGGIVKLMDYVGHARSLGYDTAVWSPHVPDHAAPLFQIDRFRRLLSDERVSFHSSIRWDIRDTDLCFISLPTHFKVAQASLPRGFSPARIIHIVQGTRHAMPAWLDGFALRLLTRPASRISVNDIVAETIRPYLDPRAPHTTIRVGHDVPYFWRERSASFEAPIKVASMTWKSDLATRVAERLDDRFEIRIISTRVGWSELRELYHWADVFLAAPLPEEGLYLPGLEALAAGCILVTPNVGGNMTYCLPGENCLLVKYDDVDACLLALEEIASAGKDRIDSLRAAGYRAADSFSLDRERLQFADLLDKLWEFIRSDEV